MSHIASSDRMKKVRYELRGKIAHEADRLRASGHKILEMHLGNPGVYGLHAAPDLIKTVASQLGKAEAYSHSKGLVQARQCIVDHWHAEGLPTVDVQQVSIGNGVSELIGVVLQALLNHGDRILLPRPDYPLWSAAATLSGADLAYYSCHENNKWQPDVAQIESLITEKTKAIVLINPNNPTGAVYSKEVLQDIMQLAERHNLVVFSDEIYSDIVFHGRQTIPAASLNNNVLCITFRGLSKNFLLAGFRCAWMICSGNTDEAKEYLQAIDRLLAMRLCANVPAQYAIELALNNPAYSLLSLYPEIQQRSDWLAAELNNISGLSCVPADGGFYLFPAVDPAYMKGKTGQAWILDFLKQSHILLAPGSTFHCEDDNHFRLLSLPSDNDLDYLLQSLQAYLASV